MLFHVSIALSDPRSWSDLAGPLLMFVVWEGLYCLIAAVTSQEVVLPYMLDDRHPVDMVFLFFKGDFQFYERVLLAPAKWLPLVVGQSMDTPEGGAGRPPETEVGASTRVAPRENQGTRQCLTR